jgi:hypothetical protein
MKFSPLTTWPLLGARLGALCVALVVSATISVRAEPPIFRDVLSDLDQMCRGWSGDDPHTDEACNVRLKIEKLLGKLGYCYGMKRDLEPGGGAGHAGMLWHKCTAQSLYRP